MWNQAELYLVEDVCILEDDGLSVLAGMLSI